MGALVKCLIRCEEGSGGSLTAQFNPKELQVDKTVSWSEAKGQRTDNPVQEFTKGTPASMSVTLYFDTFESKQDVHDAYVRTLESMVNIDEGLGHPPLVTFTWGSFVFKGVVASLSEKYTMFLPSGQRCRCEVGFKMTAASSATVGPKPAA